MALALLVVVVLVVALTLEREDAPSTTRPPKAGPPKTALPPPGPPQPGGPYVSVSAGAQLTCALNKKGQASCWGISAGCAAPSGLLFKAVAAGGAHACGITTAGKMVCWGRDFQGATRAPVGTFASLAAGWDYTCGIREDGTVKCWGWDRDGQTRAPAGSFTSVSVGYHHSCGIRKDRTIACWGGNNSGQSDAPKGAFSEVAVAQCHTCGLRPDGAVKCWGCDVGKRSARVKGGAPEIGRHTPPGKKLRNLSAGFLHTCGLLSNDKVKCWGHNAVGQSADQPRTFSSVDAGFFHTCGVTGDGRLECWGWRDPVLRIPGQEAYLARANALPARRDDMIPGAANHTCPYEGLGLLYMKQGRNRLASRSLGKAASVIKNTEYRKYLTMARRHIENGDRESANRMLRKAHAVLAGVDGPLARPGGTPHRPPAGAPPDLGPAPRPPAAPSGAPTTHHKRCERQSDCKAGEVCHFDGCMPRCSAAAPACPAGLLCDAYMGHCRVLQPPCDGAAACPRDAICHPQHRRCYLKCSDATPCAVGTACDGSLKVCVPSGSPCTLQVDCKVAGQRCFLQGCLATCSERSPRCPGGMQCRLPHGVCE